MPDLASAVADPGFPVGGVDLQHGRFSAKMYAKTKELGPVGGRAPGTPPRSANALEPRVCIPADNNINQKPQGADSVTLYEN